MRASLASVLLVASAAVADPAAKLDTAVERLGQMNGVRTVDVWIAGEKVASRTFRGAGRGAWDVKSASKSILSALVGIAIDRGVLPGLDATVAELLPEETRELEARKARISLRHLITMTPGLASTSGEAYGSWAASPDWVRSALARPLEASPGETFIYSSGNTHLIAAILARATGEDLLAWGRRVLFDPLGVRIAGWGRDPQGRRFGGNTLEISPDDLGRFGHLYLAGGRWEGRQLVPADWVAQSTRQHATGWPSRYGAYGYLWWMTPFASGDAFMAAGYGGQFLIVSPARDAVAVVTSSHDRKGEAWDVEILARVEHELLPALAAPSAAPVAAP